MKIGWFTPLHRHSAIASFSVTVCAQLAKQHAVTIYASDIADRDEACSIDLPVVVLKASDDLTVAAELSACDAVFYNMGDHLGNHRRIFAWLERQPGIVILHDLVLRNFFVGHYMTEGRFDRPALLDLVESCHGPEGRDWFRRWQEGEIPTWTADPAALIYNMAGAVTRLAAGVVVHSRFARQRLNAWNGPPVRFVPFPEPASAGPAATWAYPSDNAGRQRLNVLTFGLINQNKLVDVVIEAIARDEVLRQRLTYTVAGRVSDPLYEKRLRWLISGCGLTDSVHLVGPVSEADLHARLREADLVVNLRNPHLGESSWSLLEALFAARPTIVWNHGFYGEMPDDVVRKVASRDELTSALVQLCSAEERQRLSDRARAYAARTFSTDHYCRAITALASSTTGAGWGSRLRAGSAPQADTFTVTSDRNAAGRYFLFRCRQTRVGAPQQRPAERLQFPKQSWMPMRRQLSVHGRQFSLHHPQRALGAVDTPQAFA